MTDTLDDRLAFTVDLARRAGDLALSYFRRLDALVIESKGPQDLVSDADKAVETFIRAEIARRYPEDGMLGEEHGFEPGKSGRAWIIDPIDGTANVVRGIPAWCVVIACRNGAVNEIGVTHEPCNGETFAARRGGGTTVNGRPVRVSSATSLSEGSIAVGFSRRSRPAVALALIEGVVAEGGMFFRNASGALALAYVSAGRLLGYLEQHMNAWDCVAGFLLIEEAGGRIREPDPATLLSDGTEIVAGCPGVFPAIDAISRRALAVA